MSGVINIITRKGTARATQNLELTGGRFEYWRVMAQSQGKMGILDYAVSSSYIDNGEPVEGSGFKNGTLSANIGLPPTKNMELRWVVRYATSDTEAFPDDSGGPVCRLRQVEKRDIQELTLGGTFTHALHGGNINSSLASTTGTKMSIPLVWPWCAEPLRSAAECHGQRLRTL